MELSLKRIEELYNQYWGILKLEVNEFGCKPTEVRHLLGRLGEFHCALQTSGSLAKESNQHGFDVIADNGRKISVKTTAQKTGFVTINPRTADRVDDLMLIQFIDDKLEVVYHGSIKTALDAGRDWKGNKELDISKARKI